jgi:hypothetical protein
MRTVMEALREGYTQIAINYEGAAGSELIERYPLEGRFNDATELDDVAETIRRGFLSGAVLGVALTFPPRPAEPETFHILLGRMIPISPGP